MSMSDYANHDDDMRGGTGSVWRCAPAVSSEIPSCGPIVDMYPYIHDDEWNLSSNELVRLLNDARGAAEVVEEHSRQELDAARIGHAADVRFVSAELNELADMIAAQFERFAREMSEWFDAPQARTILGGYDREAFKASARTGRLTTATSGTEAAGKSPSPAATQVSLPHGADRLVAIGWKIEPHDDNFLEVTDPTGGVMYLSRSEIGRGAVTWLAIGASRQSMVKP